MTNVKMHTKNPSKRIVNTVTIVKEQTIVCEPDSRKQSRKAEVLPVCE